jgi:hypothetical protein
MRSPTAGDPTPNAVRKVDYRAASLGTELRATRAAPVPTSPAGCLPKAWAGLNQVAVDDRLDLGVRAACSAGPRDAREALNLVVPGTRPGTSGRGRRLSPFWVTSGNLHRRSPQKSSA